MDLSKRVVYDAEFPVVILTAEDSTVKKPVIFYVKSLQSRSIQAMEKDFRNKKLVSKQTRGKHGTLEVEDLEDLEETERSKIIASITRWEWNGNSFGYMGKDPEFTPENVAAIVDHENTQWVVDLLYAGAANVANFTQK